MGEKKERNERERKIKAVRGNSSTSSYQSTLFPRLIRAAERGAST